MQNNTHQRQRPFQKRDTKSSCFLRLTTNKRDGPEVYPSNKWANSRNTPCTGRQWRAGHTHTFQSHTFRVSTWPVKVFVLWEETRAQALGERTSAFSYFLQLCMKSSSCTIVENTLFPLKDHNIRCSWNQLQCNFSTGKIMSTGTSQV